MTNKTTNFFAITVSPAIQNLFLTEIYTRGQIESAKNPFVYGNRDSVISFAPLDSKSKSIAPVNQYIEWLVRKLLFNAFENSRALFDADYKFGEVSILNERLAQNEEYSILRRVVTRVFYAQGQLLFALDPITKIYSRLSLAKLMDNHGFTPKDFSIQNQCLVFIERGSERRWVRGTIREVTVKGHVKVEVPSLNDRVIEVGLNRAIPLLHKDALSAIVRRLHPSFDFDREIKQYGDFTSKAKLETLQRIFASYIQPLLPITEGDKTLDIAPTPINASIFTCLEIPSQNEPQYVINRNNLPPIRGRQRLAALSQVKILTSPKEYNVVLFATRKTIGILDSLVSQLNQGIHSGNYSLSLPGQFGIKLMVTDKFVVDDYNQYEGESDIFINSNEEKHRDALALVYLPPNSHLYYRLKAKLAYYGRVSQVVSKETFDIYAAWNLAANVYAKLGNKPWGISDSIGKSSADMVLGFAYSALKSEGRVQRNIGYVNVFDKHGVWQFMQSASDYFDFDKRLIIIPQMMRNAVAGYLAGGMPPRIIDIHYTKRFSYQERERTFAVINELVPAIEEVNFISIDDTHPLRIFDQGVGNFNFARGGIVQLNPDEFLLSTAGENRPTSLASRLLKVRVWRAPAGQHIDIESIAYRILAMTKLNWRSAVRETTEPVTLKYASEIARLTNHFSLTEWTAVSNQLSRIPWFI